MASNLGIELMGVICGFTLKHLNVCFSRVFFPPLQMPGKWCNRNEVLDLQVEPLENDRDASQALSLHLTLDY